MSKKSTNAKIDFIVEMIGNIEFITQRHGGVSQALGDIEGQMSILMGISQIGETIKKLDANLIAQYNLQHDQNGAYLTRNYIVHDYEGVDLGYIENIVRDYLPQLKEKLMKVQNDTNQTPQS